MAATECGHGHIYDSDLYASCPYCNSAQQVITFPEAGGGRTETVSGGYGSSSQGFGGFSASESGHRHAAAEGLPFQAAGR